jgi:type IV pilus assembly protein PilW
VTPARGFSLIELMVALAAGALLTIGLVSLHGQAQALAAEISSVAELQDTARLALAYIETDLRQAGFYGYVADPATIGGTAGPNDAVLIPVAGDCGPNFSLALDRALEGRNNRFDLGCPPYGGASRSGADVLIVRRAASAETVRRDDRLQLAGNPGAGQLLGPGMTTDLTDPVSLRDLAVSVYYVSANSAAAPGQPALRRKVLTAGPRLTDEEIAPRVEDLQVQFGLDLDPPDAPGAGSADLFVNPDDVRLATPAARIVAARIWLLSASGNAARRPSPDIPPYADRAIPPSGPGKRLLTSRTYRLANRPATP